MHTVLFVLSLICLIAVFVAGGMAAVEKGSQRSAPLASAIAALCLFLVFFLFAGIRSVPVHSVGVKTSFGKIEGSLRPGLHWFNAPWSTVNVLDETVQTQQWFASAWTGSASNPGCMTVRIGGQQLACVNLTIKWQLEDQAAPALFNDYDNSNSGGVMNSITSNLVTVDLQSVANQVFGDYNPILDTRNLAAGTAATSQFSSFGPQILTDMRADLKGKISVLSINLGNAFYAGATEQRLAAIANQFAETAIAQEELATNQALAQANAALQSGLTPLVAFQNCVNGTFDAVKAGHAMPVGWSCSSPSAIAALAAGK